MDPRQYLHQRFHNAQIPTAQCQQCVRVCSASLRPESVYGKRESDMDHQRKKAEQDARLGRGQDSLGQQKILR